MKKENGFIEVTKIVLGFFLFMATLYIVTALTWDW